MTDIGIKSALEKADAVNTTPTVLCVDDELYNLEILDKYLKEPGYETILVKNGQEALDMMVKHKDRITLVLLDRMMSGMNGIEVLKKIKSEPGWSNIPIIMQTAAAEAKEIIEGIKAGAYYYLTKPYSSDMLLAIVRSAIEEAQEKAKNKNKIEVINEASDNIKEIIFEYRTVSDAYTMANYIAALFCNNDTKVLASLTELLLNAVEHGNLNISHDLKAELIVSGKLWSEINKRLEMPEYRDKKVTITLLKEDKAVTVHIKDEGKGFNWKEYIDFDPIRMTNPSGRGLAIAHIMSPGSIEFIGNGNEVKFRIS